MKVLVACESSGVVREAFRAKGHDAWSCDLLPADDGSKFHIQGDVLAQLGEGWDLVIAHPPCTYLCGSGVHWLKARKKETAEAREREEARVAKRKIDTEKAKEFFMAFTKLTCAWCIENPIGIMSTIYRKPDQIVQPYNFGHDASKRTCFWLKGLPKLENGVYVEPRIVMHRGKERKRWANQTDSGQNRMGPSKDRWKLRSKTYKGVAEAMAAAWG